MSERIANGYKRLFEVRMLHHYWLDEGPLVFDLIPEQVKKNRRLLTYDMRSFLAVRPTVATAKLLSSFGCLFRETPLGFVVAAPDSSILPTDTTFDFITSITDSRFYDYTALTIRSQKKYEIYNSIDKITYRYKENVPFLSNLTGTSRGSVANLSRYLSNEYPVSADSINNKIESLLLSGNVLNQLISDDTSVPPQQLSSNANDLPVFLHQGDVYGISPPDGLLGAPQRGIRLTEDVTDDVFALISLTAVRPGDSEFSFVDSNGLMKSLAPVYQIRFKNRSTFWRYLDKKTGSEISIESNPLPLTYFGTAGTKKKPSEILVKVVTQNSKISRLVSEIYV